MKKSLLAIAAMTAFAGAAQAQSSVTVYGTLDASMGRVDTGATTTNGITTKLVGGATVSDRLGFKGVEDLGQGRTARFQIETGISPFSANAGTGGSGTGLATTQDTPGSLITTRRPTFIGITDKTLGSIDAGSMYSLGFLFTGYGDVGGNNTLGTNLSQATVVTSAADATGATTIGGTTSAFKMNANSLLYTSPSFAGVTARVYNVTNSGAANGAGKVTAGDLQYTLGNFNAGAVYEVKTITSNSPASKHTTMGIGAGYNFGVVNTRATIQKGSLDIDTAGVKSPTASVTVTKFTAIAPVTPMIDIFGGYVVMSENAQGTMYSASSTVQGKATLMNVGATYKFSKRTNVYAYYTSLDNDVNSKFGTTSATGTANFDPSTFAIGMRHSF